MIGESLGPYRIIEPLGAGGMGEVYLGEDTRLGRKVAIKVLPAEFAVDRERLARFEQEARAAAALNHPHIAVVYDIGFQEGGATSGAATDADMDPGAVPDAGTGAEAIPDAGIHFIVQEYLDGDTLRKPLDAGAMPLKKVLSVATEIAEALGAAHAAGIVHRDLKPENIFITKDGHAKVLDFGLAKLTEIAPAVSGSASMSPTFLGTLAGQIMGTAGYMSPEQVNGEEVDARADLFAFGCVLYEMATGRRAFSGKNLPETMHKLANVDPVPMTETMPTLPLQLQWISDKTLAKDPAERYQTAGELVVDLRRLADEGDRAPSATAHAGIRTETRSADPSAAAPRILGTDGRAGADASAATGILSRAAPWAIVVVAVAIAAWALTRSPPDEARRTPVFLPLGQFDIDEPGDFAISPDGERIVFIVGNELELIDITQGPERQAIRGTEGAFGPVFSPAGDWLAFVARHELRKVRPGGALPAMLTDDITTQAQGLSWGADGRIFYVPDWGGGILAVSENGGEVEVIASPDAALGEQSYSRASLLPDGEHLLYTMWNTHWNVVVRSLTGGDTRVLFEDFYDARYVPTGHLVFVQDRQLFAAPFNIDTLEAGEPRPVIDGLMASVGGGSGAYAFSETGTLVYLEGAGNPDRELWRVDRDGTRTLLTETREPFAWLEISPDDDRLVLTIIDGRDGQNLALFDMARDHLEPLTSGKHWNTSPFFSPDGTRLLYNSEDQDAHIGFRIRSLDASAADDPIPPANLQTWGSSWAADGTIFYSGRGENGDDRSLDIFAIAPGSGEPRVVVSSPNDQSAPHLSPNGARLTFTSNQTGRRQVYVMPYPPGDDAAPYRVSSDGGTAPSWSGDGKTIWFRKGDKILAAEVLDGGLRTSAPTVIYEGIDSVWDISADGSFVVTLEVREPPQMRLILNWFEDLEAKVPTGR